MTLRSPSGRTQPRPLSHALLRAHVASALVAVCFVGMALMAAGVVQMRSTITRNLELVARSMAFSVEAAVVFRDAVATGVQIGEIAAMEDVESVVVRDERGHTLSTWDKQRAGSSYLLSWLSNHGLLNETVRVPVLSNGRQVGEIHVKGSVDSMWGFLVTGFLWLLVCLTASLAMSAYVTRRTFRLIVHPLHMLTEVTRRVRTIRSFGERVPQADIVELNDLANDFNSLLGELEHWEAGVQGENRLLAHQALHDSLTGLPNRMAFEARLRQAMMNAQLGKRCFALLFIDSDGFKAINDNFGHAAGDRVLAEVARRISLQLRADDIVARLGGDEFAVLLDPVRDRGGAQAVAEAIYKAMAEPVKLDLGQEIVTSVSVGIAVFPYDGTDMAMLLRFADAAMYASKESHRNETASDSGRPAHSRRAIREETYSKEEDG